MKKFVPVLAIAACALCAGALLQVKFTDPSFEAMVSESCAPWDGAALNLRVKVPEGAFRASIWGQGLDDIRDGKTVFLDGKSSTTGRGRGSVCLELNEADQTCRDVKAKLHLPTIEKMDTGVTRGTLIMPAFDGKPEVSYSIKVLKQTGRPACG